MANKKIASFLAYFYRMGLQACQNSYRNFPSRIKRVNARVISVGNITWGGTGKTPLVKKLAHDLSETGKKVAILIRGYGQDEVEELKRKLPQVPVLVGRDRIQKAREAVKKFNTEIIILDDGFQHLRLHRDLDIVNINATQPFGPGGLIPQGTLREPLEHLRRAHVFVITKSDIGAKNVHWIRQRLVEIKPDAVIFEAIHKPTQFTDVWGSGALALQEVQGKKVATLAGIGDPYSFEKTLENLGAQILFAARFDDHHPYSGADLLHFIRRCKEIGVSQIITTQKDYERLKPLLGRKSLQELRRFRFLILQIEFQVNHEEDFIRRCLHP